MREALIHKQADCLGYAKLMNYLGKRFALNMGIVEVLIDNRRRYTPHYTNNLVNSPRTCGGSSNCGMAQKICYQRGRKA